MYALAAPKFSVMYFGSTSDSVQKRTVRALQDLYMLSATNVIIGSCHSAFSHMAVFLSIAMQAQALPPVAADAAACRLSWSSSPLSFFGPLDWREAPAVWM
jgi:hypothetical protein